jgi:uncharacterized protein
MGRLFFLLAVAIVVYLLVKSFRSNARKNEPHQGETQTEDMVRCAHCGVHLPRSECILSQGQTFCSPAHRDAYRK